MHKNPYWISFLSVIILGIIIYTGRAGYHIWQYVQLDQYVEPYQIQWSVLSLNPDRFVPFADYEYYVFTKSYRGQTRWSESYLNQETAQEAVKRISLKPLFVWYNSSFPQISSLQKNFPLKEILYAALLWIVALYFIGLGYYVNNQFSDRFFSKTN